ncbi:MAG TPA: hypothetical protein VJJ47_01135 [Candidatus Paceibacterota bacterium]
MVADTETQIREIRELAEETNRLVRKLHSRARWATAGSAIKWLIYAGIAFGTFVFLQPYLEAVLSGYQKIQGLVGGGTAPSGDPSFADQLRNFFTPN